MQRFASPNLHGNSDLMHAWKPTKSWLTQGWNSCRIGIITVSSRCRWCDDSAYSDFCQPNLNQPTGWCDYHNNRQWLPYWSGTHHGQILRWYKMWNPKCHSNLSSLQSSWILEQRWKCEEHCGYCLKHPIFIKTQGALHCCSDYKPDSNP